jgi:hypothetical protein
MQIRVVYFPMIAFINQEISAEERLITRLLLCVCAINKQNYDPCQYGNPSLNISPELIVLVDFKAI